MTGATIRTEKGVQFQTYWHRGWEMLFCPDAAFWTNEGWLAYKGGIDLDARRLEAPTLAELQELINDEEAP